MKLKYFLGITLWLMSSWASAGDPEENFAQEQPDPEVAVAEVNAALTALQTKEIPAAVLEAAQGFMLIPKMTTGGFVVTASKGEGLITVRNGNQWSPPVFITLSGAGAGLKAGYKSGSVVLVFTNLEKLKNTLSGNLKFGADIGVSVGPKTVAAGTDNILNADVYDYSDESGLFAGVGVEGTGVEVNEARNQGLYGKAVEVDAILAGQASPATEAGKTAVTNLQALLAKHTQ